MNHVHLILGGARSGKSRHAQALAARAEAAGARVCVLATALEGDAEMRERIARHRTERPAHWRTVEVPATTLGLAQAVRAAAQDDSCLLVDCLTLWVAQLLCPPPGQAGGDAEAALAALQSALAQAPGQAILVSNEIGLGVVPIDAGTRAVVDALGHAHQALAAQAERVSWMVAGLPVAVKGPGA